MEVKKLYDALMGGDDKNQARMFNQRKPSSASYFPENTKIIPEPRTNSLILLGPADAIKKIEEFITSSVDVDLSQPYSPLHIIQLQYADALNVANIMSEVTQFGKISPKALPAVFAAAINTYHHLLSPQNLQLIVLL